jgi:hypothetical protein
VWKDISWPKSTEEQRFCNNTYSVIFVILLQNLWLLAAQATEYPEVIMIEHSICHDRSPFGG